MRRDRWARLCHGSAWLAGLAVVGISSFLMADAALERWRVGDENEAIAGLESRVETDAGAAEPLAAAQQMRTARTQQRENRNRILAWILLVSATAFIGSAKGYQAARRPAPLQLVTLGGGRPAAASVTPPSVLAAVGDNGATQVDLACVDDVIASCGTDRESTIPLLQALQVHFRYLPEAALRRICERTEITPAEILGVASFYAQFRRRPIGKRLVRVCHGTACHVAGVGPIVEELRRRLEIAPDADTDAGNRFTIESVNCLGCCSLAPVMLVEDRVAGKLTPMAAWSELERAEAGS